MRARLCDWSGSHRACGDLSESLGSATIRSYEVTYQDILRYGNSLGKHWPLWGSGEVLGFLIRGGNSKTSPNSIKKYGAVLAALFGVCDCTSPASGPLVAKIKVRVLTLNRASAGVFARTLLYCTVLYCTVLYTNCI